MSNLRRLILFWLCVIAFVFAIFQATDAKAAEYTEIYLDQNTISRGFTIKSPDRNFWLPIFPSVLTSPSAVAMGKTSQVATLPENHSAITDFYFYDIKSNNNGLLKNPVFISIRYYSQTDDDIALYYFDHNKNSWQALPSRIDKEQKLVQAYSNFPYLQIVALQKGVLPVLPESMIVTDKVGNIVYAQYENVQRPLASLTKLITAQVFLDHNPGWENFVTIIESDNVGGASLPIRAGDKISVKDLFYATLTASKNNAARALMRSTGLTEDQFVQEMNNKVHAWGLTSTYFVEPTGLSEKNVSTAKEMAVISAKAFNNFKFLEATTIKWYELKYISDNKVTSLWLQNTNKLLTQDLYITGGKTGYTEEAGYNLVTQAKGPKQELIALVLGAKQGSHFDDVYYLLKRFL